MAHRVDQRRSEGRPAGREQRLHRVPRGVPAATARRPICRKVRQSELFVVVINGSRADPLAAARTLVVDLLPAGFEIESAIPAGARSPAGYAWLKSTTDTAYTEARDDRYVSRARPRDGVKEFTLAYVVRAVTPGEFNYPALVVEDMYEPETAGRTAIGRLVGSRRSDEFRTARRSKP